MKWLKEKKNRIKLYCILSNLIIGDLILFIGGLRSFGGEPFGQSIFIMSVVCIMCFLLLFKLIENHNWRSTCQLGMSSAITSLLIVLIGSTITFLSIANLSIYKPTDIILSLFVSVVLSLIGTIMFSFMAIGMSFISLFWLKKYVKVIHSSKED